MSKRTTNWAVGIFLFIALELVFFGAQPWQHFFRSAARA